MISSYAASTLNADNNSMSTLNNACDSARLPLVQRPVGKKWSFDRLSMFHFSLELIHQPQHTNLSFALVHPAVVSSKHVRWRCLPF